MNHQRIPQNECTVHFCHLFFSSQYIHFFLECSIINLTFYNHLFSFSYQGKKVIMHGGGGGGGLFTKLCPVLATPWTIALQAPLSMGFPRQEYWSGLPFTSPVIMCIFLEFLFALRKSDWIFLSPSYFYLVLVTCFILNLNFIWRMHQSIRAAIQISQTGWHKGQICIFSWSTRLEVPDAGWFSFWKGLSSWFADGYLLTLSSCDLFESTERRWNVWNLVQGFTLTNSFNLCFFLIDPYLQIHLGGHDRRLSSGSGNKSNKSLF